MGFGPRELQGDEQHYLGTNVGKRVESCEETIAREESVENPRKLEETVGKMRKL